MPSTKKRGLLLRLTPYDWADATYALLFPEGRKGLREVTAYMNGAVERLERTTDVPVSRKWNSLP